MLDFAKFTLEIRRPTGDLKLTKPICTISAGNLNAEGGRCRCRGMRPLMVRLISGRSEVDCAVTDSAVAAV